MQIPSRWLHRWYTKNIIYRWATGHVLRKDREQWFPQLCCWLQKASASLPQVLENIYQAQISTTSCRWIRPRKDSGFGVRFHHQSHPLPAWSILPPSSIFSLSHSTPSLPQTHLHQLSGCLVTISQHGSPQICTCSFAGRSLRHVMLAEREMKGAKISMHACATDLSLTFLFVTARCKRYQLLNVKAIWRVHYAVLNGDRWSPPY